MQPPVGLHESVVHGLLSSQPLVLPEHFPELHWSSRVHLLPSSQLPLFGVAVQPVLGSQLSSVQTLPSSQSFGDPWQLVAKQVSPAVQGFPSSHLPDSEV